MKNTIALALILIFVPLTVILISSVGFMVYIKAWPPLVVILLVVIIIIGMFMLNV